MAVDFEKQAREKTVKIIKLPKALGFLAILHAFINIALCGAAEDEQGYEPAISNNDASSGEVKMAAQLSNNMVLKGSLIFGGSAAIALLEDISTRGQMVCREGEVRADGSRVMKVTRHEVKFERGEEIIKITSAGVSVEPRAPISESEVQSEEMKSTITPPADEIELAAKTRDEDMEAVERTLEELQFDQPEENTWEMSSAALVAILKNSAAALRYADFHWGQKPDGGGLIIVRVQEGSILQKLGLHSGDRIKEINGNELHNLEGFINGVKILAETGSVTLTLKAGRGTMILTYRLNDFQPQTIKEE